MITLTPEQQAKAATKKLPLDDTNPMAPLMVEQFNMIALDPYKRGGILYRMVNAILPIALMPREMLEQMLAAERAVDEFYVDENPEVVAVREHHLRMLQAIIATHEALLLAIAENDCDMNNLC